MLMQGEYTMTFRANEAKDNGCKEAKNYLIGRDLIHHLNDSERIRSENKLREIIGEFGPAVSMYPAWHPLVSHVNDVHRRGGCPRSDGGYQNLDSTRYFVNAFITCPYSDSQAVIDSVENLPRNEVAYICAEELDVKFYADNLTPVLVSCHWRKDINADKTIPASIAIPLMLTQELPAWQSAKVAETWETMRPYFLGSPHGRRSSIFVNQETGQTMQKIWNLLIHTGMFGPLYDSSS